MTKVEQQAAFLKDFARLILKAEDFGLTVTAGELVRTQEQQDIYLKTSKTQKKHSVHQDRMAGDLNFFKDGKLTYKNEDIRPLGEYWKSLSPQNVWGGDWKSIDDTPHFQRNLI